MSRKLNKYVLSIFFILMLIESLEAEVVHIQADHNEGVGLLRARGAKCFVLAPAHVVKNRLDIKITVDKWDSRPAEYREHLDFDIAILEIMRNAQDVCKQARSVFPQTMPKELTPISKPIFLFGRNSAGAPWKHRVVVTGDDIAEFTIKSAESSFKLRQGLSGSVVYLEDKGQLIPLGQLNSVITEHNYGKVLRLDFIAKMTQDFFEIDAMRLLNAEGSVDVVILDKDDSKLDEVRVMHMETNKRLELEPSVLSFKFEKKSIRGDTVTFGVYPQTDGYGIRFIKFRDFGLFSKKHRTIYLIRESASEESNLLNRGKRYMQVAKKYNENYFDKVLALLEYHNFPESDIENQDINIKLKGYYAQALHNACTRLGYDTCLDAEKEYRDLLASKEDPSSIPKAFTEPYLKLSLEDVLLHENDVGKALFDKGEYERAYLKFTDLDKLRQIFENNDKRVKTGVEESNSHGAIDDFGLELFAMSSKYNYRRAAYQLCMNGKEERCGEAKEGFEELKSQLSKIEEAIKKSKASLNHVSRHETYLKRRLSLRINALRGLKILIKKETKKVLVDIAQRPLRTEYRRFEIALNETRDADEAVKLGEEFLKHCKAVQKKLKACYPNTIKGLYKVYFGLAMAHTLKISEILEESTNIAEAERQKRINYEQAKINEYIEMAKN